MSPELLFVDFCCCVPVAVFIGFDRAVGFSALLVGLVGLGRMLPTLLSLAGAGELGSQRSWPQAPLIPMLIHTSG